MKRTEMQRQVDRLAMTKRKPLPWATLAECVACGIIGLYFAVVIVIQL